MILSTILAFVLIMLISGIIFLIARTGKESSSWWVIRLRKISARMVGVAPWKLAIGFLIIIFVELGAILIVMTFWPGFILGLYVFSSANICFVVMSLSFDKYADRFGWFWTICKLVVSLLVGLSWVFFPNWIVYDIVGVMSAIGFLALFPALDFKRAFALGTAMVIYDIVGVYLTGWIILLVSGMDFLPPAVLLIPAALSTVAPNLMMIGLGDIIVGGMLMSTARTYGAEKAAFGGYVFAVAGAYILAIVSGHGVPATMFIIPIMLFAIWIVKKRRNTLTV